MHSYLSTFIKSQYSIFIKHYLLNPNIIWINDQVVNFHVTSHKKQTEQEMKLINCNDFLKSLTSRSIKLEIIFMKEKSVGYSLNLSFHDSYISDTWTHTHICIKLNKSKTSHLFACRTPAGASEQRRWSGTSYRHWQVK